jgi:hypothetical protein
MNHSLMSSDYKIGKLIDALRTLVKETKYKKIIETCVVNLLKV